MMTKRFSYIKNNSITQYQSLPIQETGKSKALHCQGVVDKLNKLSDENEQLKSKNRGLQSELQIFKEDVTHSNLQINKLADENEQLQKENKELRQDNDIKFWKLQCIQSSNDNQIMLFELSRAIQQGYEVSDKFKQYSNEIKEHDKEIREKHKRLFE